MSVQLPRPGDRFTDPETGRRWEIISASDDEEAWIRATDDPEVIPIKWPEFWRRFIAPMLPPGIDV